MSEIIKVPMRLIQSMPQYQSREGALDQKTIEEYAERYRQGLQMDPIQVCGQRHISFYVVDGHHRFEAMKQAGYSPQTEIDIEVLDHRLDSATVRWNAAGSNTKHGKKRTQADKRKAVRMVLEDYPAISDAKIAQHCDVDRSFVYKMRDELGIPHPQAEQLAAKQAIPPPPSSPPQTPPPPTPPSPSEEQAGRNALVDVNKCTSSDESSSSASASTIPPPPSTPKEAADETPQTPEKPKADEPPPCKWPPPPPSPPAYLLKDQAYRLVPPDKRDFYVRREELQPVLKHLRDLMDKIRKGIDENDPLWAAANENTIAHLKNAYEDIADCEPLFLCPACSGLSPGCQLCAHRGGFIGRKEYEVVKTNPTLMKYMRRGEERAKEGSATGGTNPSV